MILGRRTLLKLLATAFGARASWQETGAMAAASLPDGVPANSEKATVTGFVDGDKYQVEVGGKSRTVLMISANAPETDECFFDEAAEHLKGLIPKGTTVYLESDGDDADGKGRLLRYTWKPRDGKTAQLIDERMIADGYARFTPRKGHSKRDDRLRKDQTLAKSDKRGLWAADTCGGKKTKPKATTVPTATADLGAYETGAPGYSKGIGESRADFEKDHGAPNPQYSIPELLHYGEIDYSFLITYWDGDVWSLTYQVPSIPISQAEDLALAFIPPDAYQTDQYYSNVSSKVTVYHSDSLIDRFGSDDADPWLGSDPGTFVTIIDLDQNSTSAISVEVAAGNVG